MRESRTIKKFIAAMASLGTVLVLIWCAFYFLTIQNVKKNAGIQAEAQSEAIISRIEDELQSIEEISYYIAHDAGVIDWVKTTETIDFYDYGSMVSESVEKRIGADHSVSDIIVIGQNNLYYRLKGRCSNTVLTRVQSILNKGYQNNFFIAGSGAAYIGTARKIVDGEKEVGYVALLLDKTKLEYIFSDYSDIDYMGIALLSGDQVLCANRTIRDRDISEIKNTSVLYKEQHIDLTGLTLLVYCENTISQELNAYFYIALPVMIMVLVVIIIIYTVYWNKTTLGPQERKLMESKMKVQEVQLENERNLTGLLKKQISAHFTVNTLTVVRSLINKGEKQEAAHMCDELSWLLRYSNAPDELITLMDECHVLEQYIGIMNVRYPGRIEYIADIEDFFEEVYIPRMILQPVIENAIVHGMSGKEKIRIRLNAVLDEKLIIRIEDNGCGMSSEKLEEINSKIMNDIGLGRKGIKGIALTNIRKRIEITCGQGYGISLNSVKGEGTIAEICLKKVTGKECEDMQC